MNEFSNPELMEKITKVIQDGFAEASRRNEIMMRATIECLKPTVPDKVIIGSVSDAVKASYTEGFQAGTDAALKAMAMTFELRFLEDSK